MLVTYSWLREFVPDLDMDVDALGDLLSSLGLECDGIERIDGTLEGVIVAEVLECAPNPDADRIQLVQVDVGDGEPLQICCGAFNMVPGDHVPLATIGTTMPGGMEIARRKMRGEWSNGMLCSASEIGLDDGSDGILVLDPSTTVGAAVADELSLGDDAVFDLDLTPNRPDALSVVGVARDVAAALGLELVVPTPSPVEGGPPAADGVSVSISAPELCGQFTARVIDGIEVGTSPAWMRRRLLAAGMRPINSVVDASNYVMLEFGQPNHTYDLDRVAGAHLGVRWATEGESIVTLDGQERTLASSDGVIVDGDDRPIGIAGVMGGASTEIDESTSAVILELAWWDPLSISRTSKRLGLRSEASHRFERGVDTHIAEVAAARFAELVAADGVTVRPGSVRADGELPVAPEVRCRTARVNALLGVSLSDDEVAGHLTALGFEPGSRGDGEVSVRVPTWRPDVTAEIDLVEEVARLHGYERVGRTVPKSPHAGGLTERQTDVRRLRGALVGAGCTEAMPLPFLAAEDLARAGVRTDAVEVANPLVSEESVLRTSLLPGLLRAVGYNANYRRFGTSFFEIGHCFARTEDGDGVDEWEEMSVVLAGRTADVAVRLVRDVCAVMGVVGVSVRNEEIGGLHPGRSAVVLASGQPIGSVGEVDPQVAARWEVTERVACCSLRLGGPAAWQGGAGLLSVPRRGDQLSPISRYPSSDIDLAFVVPSEVGADAVASRLRDAGAPLVASVELFDVYRSLPDEASRSLAYRIRLQADDRTLTDEEIAEVRRRMVDAVTSATGATLRG